MKEFNPQPKPTPKAKQMKLFKHVGKRTKAWLAFRRQWIKLNPPDYRGAYTCGICGQPVYIIGMELDHVLKRSTHPQLVLDETNVRPVHKTCNSSRL